MVANAAERKNGLLDVTGGGWEHCKPSMLPANIGGAIAGIFVLDDVELGTTPAVTIEACTPGGSGMGWSASMIVSGIRSPSPDGVPVRIPFAVPFAFAVMKPMVTEFRIKSGDNQIGALSFAVLDPVPDSPGG